MNTPSNIATVVATIRARLNAAGLHTSVEFGEEIAGIITEVLSAPPGEVINDPEPAVRREAGESVKAYTPTDKGKRQRKMQVKAMPLPKAGKVPFGILTVASGCHQSKAG